MTAKAFLSALLLGGIAAAPALAQAPAQMWEPYSAGLQSRAAGGDAAAQFAMGEAFRTGNGIGQDREQAISWYRRAAPRDTRAADALAVLLFTKGERKQAIPLLQASAARRNDYALYILGTARFNGDYVPKDVARAYADMRIAAATLPQAQRSLGLMERYVTPIDRQRAGELAAQSGGPESGAPAAPAYLTAAPAAPPPRPAAPAATPLVATTPTPASVSTPPAAAAAPAPATIRTVELPPSRPAVTEPVETPPVAVAPVRAAVAPPSSAKSGGWRIQLGAYGSEERAAGQWKALTAKVPALAPLHKATQSAGSLVRLQATGIADRDAANGLCTAVTESGGVCLVLAPLANP